MDKPLRERYAAAWANYIQARDTLKDVEVDVAKMRQVANAEYDLARHQHNVMLEQLVDTGHEVMLFALGDD